MTACHKVWISATYSPAYDVHWLTRARADQIMDAEAAVAGNADGESANLRSVYND